MWMLNWYKRNMKKRILLCTLVIFTCIFTACGKSNDKKSDNPKKTVESTETPTAEPLPTADVTVTENSDGTSKVSNATAGYSTSYDRKLLEMENTGNTLKFVPSGEKNKQELNLFFAITETDSTSAEELGKQLKKNYKKSVEKKNVTLGTGKTQATCYTLTDSKKLTHQIYVITSEEKGWYIELKCPSKYKKKYMASFNDILNSIEF